MPYDYTSVTPDSVAEAADAAITTATGLVSTVEAHAGPRTWANTMGLLDETTTAIADGDGRSGFMARVHPDSTVRDAGTAAHERLSKWSVDVVFRDQLYAAVTEYAATEEAAALQGERRRYLDFWLRDFRRAGHELSPEERARVQELRMRLVELQVAFGRNLDEWEDFIEVDRDGLEGLPDAYVSGLKPGDADGTYRVTLDYPDYIPFMEQARRRDLREQLQFKSRTKAVAENRPLFDEAISVRREMASLLGYPTWAHYIMEEKMASNPDAVEEFYDSVLPGLARLAEAERSVMTALLGEDHPGADLRTWDVGYLETQLRRRDYGVDPDDVRQYFSLEQVVDGMFAITGDVFGLEYRKLDDARAWHPDVALYEMVDREAGDAIAWFYADLFPREGKYGHAAAFDLVQARRTADGGRSRPVSAIVANFTKPTEDQPSLLTHDEVLTLFLEFGHILHMSLTTADMSRFSGAETEWDFVEAPSQIMEHWVWQADVLQRFARHHETGEPIPTELVDQLVSARNLNVGTFNLRQAYFGRLDLSIHATDEPVDLEAADRAAHDVTGLPFQEGTFFLAGFGHLMGGYDAGYYGYLWSKVYGDDMFSVFENEGVLSPEVGRRYRREILEPGGSRDAADLVLAFLGREPSPDSFFRHLGLTGG